MANRQACAACRYKRRRCSPNCMLAPYFPANEPDEIFDSVHKVFGASNVRRMLKETEAGRRCELVDTLRFEARVRRFEDPVRGCAGRIANLERQVHDSQTQLAEVQTQLAEARSMNK